MNRRNFLTQTASLVLAPLLPACGTSRRSSSASVRRVRPHDPAWPSQASWDRLNAAVGGRLIRVRSPLLMCREADGGTTCDDVLTLLKNPYAIGDEPALTQTLGWADAWTSEPSVYAVAAANTADVVAAVNFARTNNLRIVIKGGGHSYQGTSCSRDSLLIWTRALNRITLQDAFVPAGCVASHSPQAAVTIEAGAVWMQAYEAVTTRAGRYVQGGGCTTVGVAGLIQSGGFGSFSKAYGMAAAALLEAEVVTADGEVRIANACSDPDLFWGLKGGGGGSLGVVTRLTLRTRELPEFIGAVSGEIQARSDRAFRQLIERIIGFYREQLFNPRWGEQIAFTSGNSIRLRMLFHGLDAQQAERTWQPLLDWLERSPDDYAFERPAIVVLPARRLWDPGFLQQYKPGVAIVDERPGVPAGRMYWAGDGGQAGQFLHGYRSAWLPASLLDEHRRPNLADALFAATRYWDVALHFNKGLAGAPADDIAAARDTAMNPVAIDAFALAIIAGEGPPSYPGISGHEPDLAAARADRREIDHAMDALLKVVPRAGSYVSESDFFESDWQHAFWGSNYPRLAAVKKQYDPDGLFFVHHGVGSEEWSADGFEKRPALGSQVEQI